jgi:hypothetical protein
MADGRGYADDEAGEEERMKIGVVSEKVREEDAAYQRAEKRGVGGKVVSGIVDAGEPDENDAKGRQGPATRSESDYERE